MAKFKQTTHTFVYIENWPWNDSSSRSNSAIVHNVALKNIENYKYNVFIAKMCTDFHILCHFEQFSWKYRAELHH
jgi:hypothetical protein